MSDLMEVSWVGEDHINDMVHYIADAEGIHHAVVRRAIMIDFELMPPWATGFPFNTCGLSRQIQLKKTYYWFVDETARVESIGSGDESIDDLIVDVPKLTRYEHYQITSKANDMKSLD